jgi:hypothetical protein
VLKFGQFRGLSRNEYSPCSNLDLTKRFDLLFRPAAANQGGRKGGQNNDQAAEVIAQKAAINQAQAGEPGKRFRIAYSLLQQLFLSSTSYK